jgi:general secretion pathway protein C
MDIREPLVVWKSRAVPELRRLLPRLAVGCSVALVVAVAYELAALTWALLPVSTPLSRVPSTVRPSDADTRASVAAGSLGGAHLFGQPPADPSPPALAEAVEAPATTLNLTLTGILFAPNGTGQAIISTNSRREETYAVGQQIEGAEGAELRAIQADRVLLARDGRLETLRLPGDWLAVPQAPADDSGRIVEAPVDTSASATYGDDEGAQLAAKAALQQLQGQSVSRMPEAFKLFPVVEDGNIIGVRIMPGNNRQIFESLGLNARDTITEVNGVRIDDAQGAGQLFESLRSSSQATVTVLRDGSRQPEIVVINTTEVQKARVRR